MDDNQSTRDWAVLIKTVERFDSCCKLVKNDAMKYTAFLLFLLLVFTGCSAAPDTQIESLEFDINERPLTCRVVTPYKLPGKSPLVIAYHGIGDTPESMARYSKLDQLAAKHQFLLVYPDAEGKLWKVPRREVPNGDATGDLEAFDAIVHEMKQRYSVDADRIYVVGMSQGATFVHWLVSQRSSEIAAAVAHSGTPSNDTQISLGKTRILLIAGQQDMVHDLMKQTAKQYEMTGISSAFISVPGLGHQWSTAHNEEIWKFLSESHR